MKRTILLILAIFAISLNTGCGTIYKASVDERSVKEVSRDELISGKILKKFLDDDLVKVLDMTANTYLGHVYLIGEYDTPAQRDRAIALARSVEGVKGITPHMLAKKDEDICGTTDNLLIRGKLDKALIADDAIWSTNVDVSVVQCHIILTGIVGSATERDKAVRHAQNIASARSVTSYLNVK